MMHDMKEWRHVFKLDPSKELSPEQIERICESGTDAIIVGGTDDVTMEGVLYLLAEIRRYPLPVALEVSDLDILTPGFDYYFVPTVLNATSSEWITGRQVVALKEYGHFMNWDEVFFQGYCVANQNCKVAQLCETRAVTEEDIVAYAKLADKGMRLPIFYLEYSGTYGDVHTVRAVSEVLEHAQFFYGGGIQNKEEAKAMSEWAHTIVVGNALYDNFDVALKTTLK